jgi:1,4-dihydroxy-2-naphthoyl-CoA hydrolase
MATDPPLRGLETLLDIQYGEIGEEEATARLAVREELLQPFGTVHGGAFAALAEGLCSRATAQAVAAEGMAALGQTLELSFLRPASSGTLTAVARLRHKGRTSRVWDVEIADDEGRVCALARMTVAVRPVPG